MERQVRLTLQEGAKIPSHIFNVGHGIIPSTPVENVQRAVELVHAGLD
ncbi:MAG: hypothetical protein KDD62_09325 [Bdellovibrionales bacterium]|nr:hypothetical protein [Bdellovibrionales bacterium]